MTTYDFNERLQYSHDSADEPWWPAIYEQAFPGCTPIDMRHDGTHQRRGIDRILILREGGERLTVDEKTRDPDYDDLLIEYWSVWIKGRPSDCVRGWIYTAECDYLAYAFKPTKRCFIFPMRELQRAWRTNGKEWGRKARNFEEGFSVPRDPTQTSRDGVVKYQTLWIAVPFPVIQEALTQSMLFYWD